MMPATWPRADSQRERLLHVDPALESLRDGEVRDLARWLEPGDALIVNDAATLPASLRMRDGLELRLIARLHDDASWRALLFGAGSWRTPTERRAAPPVLAAGAELAFSDELRARVTAVDPEQPRLIELRFDRQGAQLLLALYRVGKPIQYSHLAGPLALYHVQNGFASRPWALEMPSAGRPLSFGLLRALAQRGVALASVTHAAGISSTGSEVLDRRLPVPERYEVPLAALAAIRAAKQAGKRVIAAGTTVVRALEAHALARGERALVAPATGEATLLLGPGFRPRLVDGLLTGMHVPATSQFALLEAFAPRALLERAHAHAEEKGYLEHEFGDSMLVLPSA